MEPVFRNNNNRTGGAKSVDDKIIRMTSICLFVYSLDYFEFFDDIDGIIDIKPLMNGGITFVMFGQKESILAKEKLSKHKFFKEITSKGLHLIIESIEDSYRNRGEHLFV